MRILNFGSLNIDHVYSVDHFLKPGETAAAKKHEMFLGGKGLNQSIAAARAGGEVYHAGMVGKEGDQLKEYLKESGVDTACLQDCEENQGHAVIQVNPKGENCIIVYGGSNHQISKAYVDEVLEQFDENTYLLLQNEINEIPYIVEKAFAKGMKIALNPSPMDEEIRTLDFSKIDWLFINEVEGKEIAGTEENILEVLTQKYPKLNILLTLGSSGSVCKQGEKITEQCVYPVEAVDTTAAGDTFTGYFLAALADGKQIPEAMRMASAAAAISVSKKGASVSIPVRQEVVKFLSIREI